MRFVLLLVLAGCVGGPGSVPCSDVEEVLRKSAATCVSSTSCASDSACPAALQRRCGQNLGTYPVDYVLEGCQQGVCVYGTKRDHACMDGTSCTACGLPLPVPDAGASDAGASDAGVADAGVADAGVPDAGQMPPKPLCSQLDTLASTPAPQCWTQTACTVVTTCATTLPRACSFWLGTYPLEFGGVACDQGFCRYQVTKAGGCIDQTPCDNCPMVLPDAGTPDAGRPDAGRPDAGVTDGGSDGG